MKHMSKTGKNNGYTKKADLKNQHNDRYDDNFNNHSKYVDISSGKPRKIAKLTPKKIVSLVFFTILGLLGMLMIYAYMALHSFNYEGLPEDTELVDEYGNDLISDSQVLNIMLIGSDSMSVGDHGRSDSLLIVSLDVKNKKIKVTSLMRDIWINIPGYGKDRFNAAYAFGGPKLTISTIEKTFGIRIDRYMVVDFEGFSRIIDALGGIDLELDVNECAYINTYSGDKHILKGSGVKHLTGLQALHYSRNRNSKGSDYDRTRRQRNVIRAIIEKLKDASLTQVTDFISAVGPLVTTNFKTSEISRLGASSLEYLNYPMTEFRLPTDDNVRNETYDKKMVLVINDIAKAKKDLLNFIYEDEDMAEKEAGKVKIQPIQTTNNAKSKTQASTASNIPVSESQKITQKSSAENSNRSYQSQKSKQASKSTSESTPKPSKSSSPGESTKSSSQSSSSSSNSTTNSTTNSTNSSSNSTSGAETNTKNSTSSQKSTTTPKE